MKHVLPKRVGIAAGVALVATLIAATVLASTSDAKVTPSIAEPGDEVTVVVHIFGGGFWGTDLYLVPTASVVYEAHCADMDGALLVGSMEWTHDGLNHYGAGQFTLPEVSDGPYNLFFELGNVIPPCFPAGAMTVGGSSAPDTAMQRTAVTGGSLPVAGLILLMAAAVLVARRSRVNAQGRPL